MHLFITCSNLNLVLTEEHSKKVRKHRTEMREEKQKEVVKARVKATEMSDEELWARLDQLETQEASRREMEG